MHGLLHGRAQDTLGRQGGPQDSAHTDKRHRRRPPVRELERTIFTHGSVKKATARLRVR